MPFNPAEITPTASINRVRIVDLPGISPRYALRDEERNKTAYDLLGAKAVYALIQERAHLLELPTPLPQNPTNEIMAAFQACFSSKNPFVQNIAKEIRAIVHRRIAILLAVLRRGDPINREARPEWDDSYWTYWGERGLQIIIGGGLLRDDLGLSVENSVRLFFVDALEKKNSIPSIRRDPYGAYWPLVGAAYASSPDRDFAAVLDFGGTSVKTGIVHAHQGTIVSIQERGSFPGPFNEPYSSHLPSESEKISVFQTMVARIAATIQSSPYGDRIDQAIVSVAAYVNQTGHPYPNSIGGYASLQSLGPNLQTALAESVSQVMDRPIKLRLLHDGTAAATAYPGRIVLVFGTAIGFGSHYALSDRPPLHTDKPPSDLLD